MIDLEDLEQKLCHLYTKYELKRFDHICLINNLRTQKRPELIELACAAFYSFSSFFHVGYDTSNTYHSNIEQILNTIHIKQDTYKELNLEIVQQRQQLATALATIKNFNTKQVDINTLFPSNRFIAQTALLRGKNVAIEKQSYLRKLSSSVKRDFKRRWFFLNKKGNLLYYRDDHLLQPNFIAYVLTCTIVPNTTLGLRYVFDIISPNRRIYTLQAESKDDYDDWLQVFQNCTEAMMVGDTDTKVDLNQPQQQQQQQQLVHNNQQVNKTKSLKQQLFTLNPNCADCHMEQPDWASINLGILICIKCSGVHRSLGVHISKVRSLTLDTWDDELLQYMLAIGNIKSNLRYDYGRDDQIICSITTESTHEQRYEYIISKYQLKAFLAKDVLQLAKSKHELMIDFIQASYNNNLTLILHYHALGANVDWQEKDTNNTALYIAVVNGYSLILEFCIQNNANIDLKNPLDDINYHQLDLSKKEKDIQIKACYDRLYKISSSKSRTKRPRANTNNMLIISPKGLRYKQEITPHLNI